MGIPTASEGDTQQPKSRFVVSGSGHAAHPDDITESCRALLAHVTDLQRNAEKELHEFDERIKQRDLAEKRRVAPGWLDSESRLLEPETAAGQPPANSQPARHGGRATEKGKEMAVDPGAELDRAFGGMDIK